MVDEYLTAEEQNSSGESYKGMEVHNWRPPCSCGVELGEALNIKEPIRRFSEVHFWRPPCSCGVSLEEAVD